MRDLLLLELALSHGCGGGEREGGKVTVPNNSPINVIRLGNFFHLSHFKGPCWSRVEEGGWWWSILQGFITGREDNREARKVTSKFRRHCFKYRWSGDVFPLYS